ncbi:MAG: class I SAM-dependent rRNA methyltransferase [Myxococcales bacterium]|nr:class I SAM-dependent rRNA methyltransferase [Myxococcales bacterium]
MTPRPASTPAVRLKKNLERAIAHGHPWLFREALTPLQAPAGTVVDVLDRRGRFIAKGLWDNGPIAVRIFSLVNRPLDAALFAARIDEALGLREVAVPPHTDASRLIHGEGDRLPGLVVDRYGPYAIVILDNDAIDAHRDTVVDALLPALARRNIPHVALRQGRGPTRQLLPLAGELPPRILMVSERGMTLAVNLHDGQKTGLFLDHREARFAIRALCAALPAPRVLNLYGYTGGFSVAAGLGGASEVVTVDLAKPALDLAEKTWRANGLDPRHHRVHAERVDAFLTRATDAPFDIVIADPPSFAPNESSVTAALKAYRALHAAALLRVCDGGYYLAASCSSHIHRDAFEGTVRDAAHERKRSVQVLQRMGAGMDHPVPLGFAQGDYLTTLLCRIHRR